MRLDKYLADALNISRVDAKKLIKQKKVSVNEEILTNTNLIINEFNDSIKVEDELIKYQKYIYLMLNKPSGYLSATFDKQDKTVIDLIPNNFKYKDLSIVGRLDKDTEGLLLLSNDGSFIHHLTSPKKHIPKKYYVEYSGTLLEDSEELVKKGLNIDNEYITLPGSLERINEDSAYITIYEGKFHQVKKMFDKLNTKVTYLKRVKIGNLELGDLKLGQIRELTENDIEKLKG